LIKWYTANRIIKQRTCGRQKELHVRPHTEAVTYIVSGFHAGQRIGWKLAHEFISHFRYRFYSLYLMLITVIFTEVLLLVILDINPCVVACIEFCSSQHIFILFIISYFCRRLQVVAHRLSEAFTVLWTFDWKRFINNNKGLSIIDLVHSEAYGLSSAIRKYAVFQIGNKRTSVWVCYRPI